MAASAGPALAQNANAPAGNTPAAHFDINEIRVEGNTVLPPTEIERVIYDHLGPNRTVADVEAARAALEEAYAKAGYPTVSAEIPVQRVAEGIVVLRVTERKVGRLRVTNSRYYALGEIKAAAPSLAEGKVPRMPDVQHDIVGLNQWPGRSITPTLKAGVAPGTVDVDLQVQDQSPLHANLELNNRRSQDTHDLRLSASLSYDNLWQRGDSATATFQIAPQRPADATVESASYLFRIPDSPLSLLASYLHSDSDVTTIGGTGVVGRGYIVGGRLVVPLGFEDGFVHSLNVGMDFKHFGEDTLLGADRSKAPITYYPFSASYSASWLGTDSDTSLLATLLWTFRGLGSSRTDFDNKRSDASPSFQVVRADLSHTERVGADVQLYAHTGGQVATGALISNEQLSVGGLDSVRGYQEAELLADQGWFIQTEARSPDFARFAHLDQINEVRLVAFLDAGEQRILQNIPGSKQNSYTGVASTGIGIRLRLLDDLNGEVFGAFPLLDGAPTQTHAGDARILFRVYGGF